MYFILIRFLYYTASVYFLYKILKIITIEFHVITALIYLNFYIYENFLYGIQFIFIDLKYGFGWIENF